MISGNLFEKLILNLFELLEHPSGQVRHYSVNTLLQLGVKRKDVILKLVSKLDDPVPIVRNQVKIALREMAGKVLRKFYNYVNSKFGVRNH